ncbi:hypothetical protein ANCCAN_04650 [Ancylostoma caninum]|uniref:Peptidase M1 membrane alanine aminopeptidase domain-containing protein n=1 Tax=Ancylostoma caninum TaxID=29170 RepID=A0A368H1T1_ANCCA|nr:hypothetical protein ANCCAN_04650 [Ancylostoma caninum]
MKGCILSALHLPRLRWHKLVLATPTWFGNLVTLKGWEDLWLNEGFANYFENTMLYKNIDGGLTFSRGNIFDFERALEQDSFASGRPLSSIINTTSEVHETFDSISYDKGSAIISMTAKIIGKKNFRKGINNWKKFDQALESSTNSIAVIMFCVGGFHRGSDDSG